jgi:hypothetical protein
LKKYSEGFVEAVNNVEILSDVLDFFDGLVIDQVNYRQMLQGRAEQSVLK